MENKLLDTNVIIRVLVQDGGAHLTTAKTYISNIEQGKYRGIISPIIVAECVYVLSGPYNLNRTVISDILQMFFLTKNFCLEEDQVITTALNLFGETSLDFADCYLIAKAKKKNYDGILTFDKKLNEMIKT